MTSLFYFVYFDFIKVTLNPIIPEHLANINQLIGVELLFTVIKPFLNGNIFELMINFKRLLQHISSRLAKNFVFFFMKFYNTYLICMANGQVKIIYCID